MFKTENLFVLEINSFEIINKTWIVRDPYMYINPPPVFLYYPDFFYFLYKQRELLNIRE